MRGEGDNRYVLDRGSRNYTSSRTTLHRSVQHVRTSLGHGIEASSTAEAMLNPAKNLPFLRFVKVSLNAKRLLLDTLEVVHPGKTPTVLNLSLIHI